MSIRAVFIMSIKENADIPIFSRYFHSVEVRCKSRSGQLYVKIPPEEEFVKLLFTETGVKKGGGTSMEVRDRCEDTFSNPALQLTTKSGILWPVLVMQHKNLMYSAVTFEENLRNYRQSSGMKLSLMSNVTMCLEVLSGLANCVEHYSLLQGKTDISELQEYINSAIPFGRPVCCTPTISLNFLTPSWRGKAKQPAWNPLEYKDKSSVILCVKEEIRCIQFSEDEMDNYVTVYGAITCTANVEGVAPEISLVIANPSENKYALLVDACVSNVENISPSSTRVRFHPVKSQKLCLYKMIGHLQPPITGKFSMKIKDDIVSILLHLKLQRGVKNKFQNLEVHIPMTCPVSTVKSQCSQGSLVVGSNKTLIWNVGTKLPSKTLEATLHAKGKLRERTIGKPLETLGGSIDKVTNALEPISSNENTTLATVHFTISDYTYSGCKIDVQSIVVSTMPKVTRSVSCECFSGIYEICNNDISFDRVDDLLAEEFMTVLEII